MNIDYISNNYSSNLTLYIKLHYYVRHEKDWFEHRTKSNYTLWILQKGNIFLEINGITHKLQPGHAVFFYPGDTYSAYTDEDGCQFLFFIFSVALGNQIDILSGNPYGGIYKDSRLMKRNALLVTDYLIRGFGKGGSVLTLYAFFLEYLAELISKFTPTVPFSNNQPTRDNLLIHEIIEYMNLHFTESITIAQLASRFHKTEKSFISFFYDRVGTPPKRYLIEKRMQLAIELLQQEELRLADVAAACGYADAYCFSKAFKKHFGESPSESRRAFTETRI